MTTTVLTPPEVTITPQGGAGFPLDIVENTFNFQLDEGQSPYVQAGAVVLRPDNDTYAALEPTKQTPVIVTVSVGAVVPITTTMFVFERVLDPEADTVALKFVSRENDLQTYSPFNIYNWTNYQSSVRNICQQVVQQATGVSATVALVGGATDKTFYTFTEAKNLFPNPDIATTTGFSAQSSSAALSRVQATGSQASYGYAARSTAGASGSRLDLQYISTAPTPIRASAGQQYTLSMAARVNGTSPSVTLYMQFFDTNNTVVQTFSKTLGAIGSTFTTRYFVTATAPSGTAGISWVLRNTSAVVSGNVLDAAQVMVLEGNGQDPNAVPGTPHPFFSGATSDTADYHYSWDGDANVSESSRTPLVERPPDTLLWTSGTSGYDFLKPILDAVGLRLFLREDGQWCLADNGYSVAGQLAIQYGSNLYEGSELLSLGETDVDGFPMNADAVILNYAWTDSITGVEKTASDVATTASYKRPFVQEIDAPFPGPGQARYLLTRLQARQYRIESTVRPDWTARPGMTAFISLANRPAQTGYVQALEFDLASGRMAVTTKGLVTAVSGSYGNAPTTQTYASVASSVTYANYTN
ncbi:MAG: hypothetical protein AAGC90_10410 [Curtobacterium sp.]